MKAHPALFEGEGRGRGNKNWGTLSRGFGLRSFCPEISALGVFVSRRFRPEEFLSAGDFDLGSLLSALLCSLLLTNCNLNLMVSDNREISFISSIKSTLNNISHMFIINSLRRQGKNQRGVSEGAESTPLEKCQSRFLTIYSYTTV